MKRSEETGERSDEGFTLYRRVRGLKEKENRGQGKVREVRSGCSDNGLLFIWEEKYMSDRREIETNTGGKGEGIKKKRI